MKKNKDIDIEYTKVAERTKKIKGNLKKGELEKAKQKYTDMINEVNECKGTYKDAMVRTESNGIFGILQICRVIKREIN